MFTHFLSEQMLSCMERIHKGEKLKWNFSRPSNWDFERLWVYLSQRLCAYLNRERNSKLMVRNVTGMEFTMDNLVRHFEERRSALRLGATSEEKPSAPCSEITVRALCAGASRAQISPYKEPLCTAHLTSARAHKCLGALGAETKCLKWGQLHSTKRAVENCAENHPWTSSSSDRSGFSPPAAGRVEPSRSVGGEKLRPPRGDMSQLCPGLSPLPRSLTSRSSPFSKASCRSKEACQHHCSKKNTNLSQTP